MTVHTESKQLKIIRTRKSMDQFFLFYLYCFCWSLCPNRCNSRDTKIRQMKQHIIAAGDFIFLRKECTRLNKNQIDNIIIYYCIK